MKKIEVFYHHYIPPDANAVLWIAILDEQLGSLESSGLHKIANVSLTVTLPMLWNTIFYTEFPFKSNLTGDVIDFHSKFKEYVYTRYPFVRIIDVRDSHYTNLYEGQCLSHLSNRSKEVDPDTIFLYFHSKGAINSSIPSIPSWRKFITHHCVTRWIDAVSALENADVVAVKDRNNYISGNFWWSKASYLKRLHDPLTSQLYVDNSLYHPTGSSYRYAFEKWITSKNPSVAWIAEVLVDPYTNYCFIDK